MKMGVKNISGLNSPETQNGGVYLRSLEIKDVPVIGDRFLCIQDVRMLDDGELVYKKGEFYQSERDGCITDQAGRIEHYWEDTDWTEYFIRWEGHKRKQHDRNIRESKS